MARPKAPPVKIIVDVHERQSGIADTLAELGAEIEIARLPAGDYAVGADTLVEPKRALDLHAAVLKGRLWPLPSAASSSSRLPSGLPTRSDPDRSRVTRLRRPSSPPCPASRRPPRALLERFGSVAAVVAADRADWIAVPGIGPERARALEETFHLRRGSSNAR